MRTEITIPFAFDTTPIEHMMRDHGIDEAMKILREIVEENAISQIPKMRDRYYYVNNHYVNNGNDPDWKGYMDDIARNWLDEHAQEIVDEAALLLAAKAGRKKAWREVLAEIRSEDGE